LFLEGKVQFKIEWNDVKNRILGRNRIPVAVIFENPESLALFLGKKKEYTLFLDVKERIMTAFPELKNWLLKNTGQAAYIALILSKLISVAKWVIEHPMPRIYLRQIILPGVDTKFIEANKKIIGEWLDILLSDYFINSNYTGVKGFEKRYGFLSKPELVRFRMLDENRAAGFSDITVRADEFCRTAREVSYVFVTENDINGLSFPAVKSGIVIFGRGYGFDLFREASWLRDREIWYWGDIDTHGFAILSRFREYFPQAKSLLMTEDVLLACRDSWSTENESAALPERLSEEEKKLFLDMKENRFGKSVRLEQELIPYNLLKDALSEIGMEL
jgi:hypothetical protein